MEPRAKLIQPGLKLTSISPSRIERLKNADIIDLHDRTHELYQLGKKLEDTEVCHRAEQAHRRYAREMLQRGISHPYYDEMDNTTHVTEAHEDEEQEKSQPDPHADGIMLAFFLPSWAAEKIVARDGEPADKLHMTLVYLGNTSDWDHEQLAQLPGVVSVYATNSKPMCGTISGMGRFAALDSSDGQDVLYHSVDLPDLPGWRQGLIEWLEGAGFTQKSEHGYTPHITIKYLAPNETSEIGMQEQIQVEFGELTCKIGDKVYHFPLASLHMMKPNKWADKLLASQERIHESRASMFHRNSSQPTLLPDAGSRVYDLDHSGHVDDGTVEILEGVRDDQLAAIISPDQDHGGKKIIYGVLIVPDEPDLDGTIFSADVIARACAEYSNSMQPDENHKDIDNPGLNIADSFISTDGYELNGHKVKPGSWIVGIRTDDPDVIAKVRSGDYGGLSIEGAASVISRKISEGVA